LIEAGAIEKVYSAIVGELDDYMGKTLRKP